MLQLGQDLGISPTEQSPWYRLSTAEIRRRGGFGLLRLHDGSVSKILQSVFPEFQWDLSKFVRKPRNYWDSIDQQREYVVNILGPKLGIQQGELHKWYQVSNDAIVRGGGSTLLAMNGYSVFSLVSSLFPEHPWDASKFLKRTQGHWADPENQRKGLQEIAARIGIAPGDFDAWYKVSVEDFGKANAWGLLSFYRGSPSLLVATVFAEHKWDLHKFAHNKLRTVRSRTEPTI